MNYNFLSFPWLSLIKLEKYNLGKWSQMMDKVTCYKLLTIFITYPILIKSDFFKFLLSMIKYFHEV